MSKPKRLSAMDLLLKSDTLKPALSQNNPLSRSALANLQNGTPVEISAEACRPWVLADRPLSEVEHKADLIRSFQNEGIGQLQPVVVRSVRDADAPEIRYEIICGRVRWLAARELGMPLQAIVRELSDTEAYGVMSTENKQRKRLSDWAKAKSYQKALSMGVFATAQQLAEVEEISKSKLSLYLGFAELPDAVAQAFTRLSKLSYRTGYALSRACKVLGVEEVLPLIPKLEAGEISRDELDRMQIQTVTAAPPLSECSEVDPENRWPEERKAPVVENSPYGEAPTSRKAHSQPVLTENTDADHDENTSAPPPRAIEPSKPAVFTDLQLKKTCLSASGRRLFTYHQASRGWLIRMSPDLSPEISEELIVEIGHLIESRLNLVQ